MCTHSIGDLDGEIPSSSQALKIENSKIIKAAEMERAVPHIHVCHTDNYKRTAVHTHRRSPAKRRGRWHTQSKTRSTVVSTCS